jgi:hypothetical protein
MHFQTPRAPLLHCSASGELLFSSCHFLLLGCITRTLQWNTSHPHLCISPSFGGSHSWGRTWTYCIHSTHHNHTLWWWAALSTATVTISCTVGSANLQKTFCLFGLFWLLTSQQVSWNLRIFCIDVVTCSTYFQVTILFTPVTLVRICKSKFYL